VDGKDGRVYHHRTPYGSGILASNEDQLNANPEASGGWYAVEARNPLVGSAGVSSERFYLYKPGSALIVIDHVRASKSHSYRRYFQLGPTVNASKTSGGFNLTASGLSGHLWSESSTGEKVGMARGQNEPSALGWVFTDF